MQYFIDKGLTKKYVLRLDPGDLVLESISDVVNKENIKNGMILSGIGTLSQAELHMVTSTGYPAVETRPKWENTPLELCSIDGIIADYIPHLHVVISDSKYAYGGHLELGCKTLYLCEIVIEAFNELELKRIRDEKDILILQEQ